MFARFGFLVGFLASVVVVGLGLVMTAQAAAPLPTADLPGTKDLAWLKRYAGSVILDATSGAFDEVTFPASQLKSTGARGGDKNNILFKADTVITVQGTLTRHLYVVPEGRSPLEVVANYEEEIAGKGGSKLYACKDAECGGNLDRGPDLGGSEENILHHLYPAGAMKQPAFSAGSCALFANHDNLRYALFKTPTPGSEAHVAVVAYNAEGIRDCAAVNQRTIVAVIALEAKPREQRMETVSAAQMGSDIVADGRAVLYGIYFDTDKATIKPESKPQMDEIASYLKGAADRKFLVVGHTDNQGELAYNQGLSERRASAVAAALVKDYGIAKDQLTGLGVGMAAPIASNETDEGRAKNRRVEIVVR